MSDQNTNRTGSETSGTLSRGEEKTEFGQKTKGYGRIAVRMGFLEKKELKKALAIYRKARDRGKDISLRTICTRKGYLTREEAQQVYERQGKLGGHRDIEGYHIEQLIGEGTMGEVYRGRQRSLDRPVAIKVLAPRLATNEDFVQQFVREAKNVAKLNHPNIPEGIDAGTSNGVHYFVMEYIDGPTMRTVLDRGGALAESRALKFTTEVARALDHANKHDMVHRDVKPDNIMISASGRAKLCDLGLARVLTRKESRRAKTVGTPNYIAPEQIEDSGNVDIRADIYSLGATFYHMLTGEVPFPGSSGNEIMQKHLEEKPKSPRKRNSQVRPRVSNICMRMLKKKPANRFAKPSFLLKALESVRN